MLLKGCGLLITLVILKILFGILKNNTPSSGIVELLDINSDAYNAKNVTHRSTEDFINELIK